MAGLTEKLTDLNSADLTTLQARIAAILAAAQKKLDAQTGPGDPALEARVTALETRIAALVPTTGGGASHKYNSDDLLAISRASGITIANVEDLLQALESARSRGVA